MKIVFEGEIFAHQRYGGISRYFAELASGFVIAGHTVRNICPLRINHYIESIPGIENIGVRVPVVQRTSRLRIAASNFLSQFVPDCPSNIVHETYYGSHRRRYTSPVVTTIHDMIYEKSDYDFHDRKFLIRAKQHCIDRADHIICVSEWTRQELLEIYPNVATKTTVIHHGNSITEACCKPNVPLPNSPYLLYVGLRDNYKNFSLLISALGQLHSNGLSIPLVAFGGGVFTSAERELFTVNKLSQNQIFQLSGSDLQLSWLYQNALAFIFPSLAEGFGIPLLEALSLGCIVLCSKSSCLPEIANDAAIYFDASSSEDLAVNISKLLEISTDERVNLVKNGIARCSMFSWDTCVAKTLGVYNSLQ